MGKTVPGTPSWLRARNDRTAFQLLLDHGPLTRNQLGELTGLSKPTSSQIVQRLESVELISAAGTVSAGRGPEASTYAVRTDQTTGVAIDIDARSVRSSVVDITGAQHPVAEVALRGDARTPLDDVRSGIDEACALGGVPTGRIDAVCIGVQGSVDPHTDELHFADTLVSWPRRSVRARLESELGVSVTIENDVNLAALAERAQGVGTGLTGFTLLWLGEGLGLAIDLNGTLQRGTSGGAGEIGYLPAPRAAAQFDPEAEELQDLIGGIPVVSLVQQAGADAQTYADALAALRTDAAARERTIASLAPRVALGIIPVLALIDPERVVLGGPTAIAAGAELADAVAETIRSTTQWRADVAVSAVPVQPVLAGARHSLLTTLRTSLFERLDHPAP